MALETCIAFLLADDLDADQYAKSKTKCANNSDDAEAYDSTKNYAITTVPSLSDVDFQRCFQLTHSQVDELVNWLTPLEWASGTLEVRTVMQAVLSSLWTLSTLEPYSSVATRFHTSEAIICQQLNEFCTLITENFSNRIHWPKMNEAAVSVAGFSAAVGLPGIVCAVGSCLIPIERPTDVPNPDLYRNSEDSFSVNLLAFCNYQGCFTHVSAEHPGSWHNSRVLLETKVGRELQEDPVNLLHGKHIVGDATFPLSEHLLTPFPDNGNLGEKKLRYNLKVQDVLRVVQGSLHRLKSRFQRLKSLQINTIQQTSLVVRTCCILYNMYMATSNTDTVEWMEECSVIQQPFYELPNGHSGSLGGISKRQDMAASLGRKSRNNVAKGYYINNVWYEA